MTYREFAEQLERLQNTFSDRAFPDERVKLIWDSVKNLDARDFKKIADVFIADSRQPPMVSDFRAQASIVQGRNVIFVDRWDGRPKSSCPYCYGLGVFIAQKESSCGLWAFRCHCDAGINDPRKAIPHFRTEHRDEGFTWVSGKRIWEDTGGKYSQ